jgi:predicted O-methyltransferase YrrM
MLLFDFILAYCKHSDDTDLAKFLKWGDLSAIGYNKERKDYGRGILLYSLVQTYKPQSILEIGTGRGYSTTCIYHAMKSYTKKIDITSIDIDTIVKPRLHPCGNVISVKKILKKTIGDLSGITFIAGKSHKKLPPMIEEQKSFDFIFVDGSHKKDYVLFDIEYCLQLISPNGTIVFHDYGYEETPGVTNALNEKMADIEEKFNTVKVCSRGDFTENPLKYNVIEKMGSLVCFPKK